MEKATIYRKIMGFSALAISVCLHISCVSVNRAHFLSWGGLWSKQRLPNFCRVNDRLYRGGQPTKRGFEKLKKIGVRTIVNLRSNPHHTEKERRIVTSLGLNYVSIPIKGAGAPNRNQLKRFFSIVKDQELTPVFVHCRMGSDRTGAVVAAYRICVEGWSADMAYREMKSRGFNEIFNNLREFVYNLARRRDQPL